LGGTSRQPTLEHVPNHRKCRQAARGLGRTCRQRLCKIIIATRAKKVGPFGALSTSSEPQVASRRTPIIEVAGPFTEAPHYKRRACRFSTVKFAKCLPVSAGHTDSFQHLSVPTDIPKSLPAFPYPMRQHSLAERSRAVAHKGPHI
jgi:hypothetical protein